MSRRFGFLLALLGVISVAAGCSSSANAVFRMPATSMDRLKPALALLAAHGGLKARARIATTEPCTFADFTDDPRMLVSLKARRIGTGYEVRLVSTGLGARYERYRKIEAELESTLRTIYGRALNVAHDERTYPVCTAL